MEKNLMKKSEDTNTIESIVEGIVERLLEKKFSIKEKELREAAEPRKYYTRDEVCQILHVSKMTLWNMVGRRQIQQLKVGKRVLFAKEDIDNAVSTQQVFRYQHITK